MGNVWEAMKKHQAEEAQKGPSDTAPAEAASGVETLAPETSSMDEDGRETAPNGPAPAPGNGAVPSAAVEMNARYSELLVAHHDRGGTITEEYRALRTSLLAQNPDGRFGCVITSADPKEGKTVTSVNLAVVMAERVDRLTVVVDGDLRRSRVADLLDARPDPGMSELLRGTVSLEDCIVPTVYPNLFVLPAGKIRASEVGELMGRPELHEIIGELRRRYDHVIIDSPPISTVSDAGVIAHILGQALLVVRMNKTRRESAEKALRLLRAADVETTGIVLTHRKFHLPHYVYRYS